MAVTPSRKSRDGRFLPNYVMWAPLARVAMAVAPSHAMPAPSRMTPYDATALAMKLGFLVWWRDTSVRRARERWYCMPDAGDGAPSRQGGGGETSSRHNIAAWLQRR